MMDDPPSSGEWIFFALVLIITLGVLTVGEVIDRWHRNPATGLRRPLKRRRARGPLKSHGP